MGDSLATWLNWLVFVTLRCVAVLTVAAIKLLVCFKKWTLVFVVSSYRVDLVLALNDRQILISVSYFVCCDQYANEMFTQNIFSFFFIGSEHWYYTLAVTLLQHLLLLTKSQQIFLVPHNQNARSNTWGSSRKWLTFDLGIGSCKTISFHCYTSVNMMGIATETSPMHFGHWQY